MVKKLAKSLVLGIGNVVFNLFLIFSGLLLGVYLHLQVFEFIAPEYCYQMTSCSVEEYAFYMITSLGIAISIPLGLLKGLEIWLDGDDN